MQSNLKMKGSLSIIISAFCFASYGIWSKMMAGVFDDFFQSWTRALIIIIILVPIGIIFKQLKKIEKEDIKWYLTYTIPGAIVVPTMFYAFTKLSVGTTMILFYSMLTISTYIYGMLFFKEKMNYIKITALILGIAGLLVTYSMNIEGNSVPIIIAIVSGICSGTEVVFTKKVSEKYSPIQLTIGVYAVCLVLTFIMFLIIHNFSFNINSSVEAWVGNIGHTISSIFAFLFMVKGYELLEPSIAGIIGLLEIPLGIILAFIIFSEPIDMSILIGGGLIVIASLIPNIYEIIKVRKDSKSINTN